MHTDNCSLLKKSKYLPLWPFCGSRENWWTNDTWKIALWSHHDHSNSLQSLRTEKRKQGKQRKLYGDVKDKCRWLKKPEMRSSSKASLFEQQRRHKCAMTGVVCDAFMGAEDKCWETCESFRAVGCLYHSHYSFKTCIKWRVHHWDTLYSWMQSHKRQLS